MRIFFSEFNSNYTTYTFGYAVYAITESELEIEEAYQQGFLPYSSDLSIKEEIFYLCRSVRIALARFVDSSENRRVDRKFDDLKVEINLLNKSDLVDNKEFVDFCLSYAEERFVGGTMSRERLNYVLARQNGNAFLEFKVDGRILAYVLIGINGKSLHYWYSFFDYTLLGELPVGKWVMWKTIRWAMEKELSYVYLGTCYKEKALYKVRDFKGVEFFVGEREWSSDVNLLKKLCKEDGLERSSDHYKMLPQ